MAGVLPGEKIGIAVIAVVCLLSSSSCLPPQPNQSKPGLVLGGNPPPSNPVIPNKNVSESSSFKVSSDTDSQSRSFAVAPQLACEAPPCHKVDKSVLTSNYSNSSSSIGPGSEEKSKSNESKEKVNSQTLEVKAKSRGSDKVSPSDSVPQISDSSLDEKGQEGRKLNPAALMRGFYVFLGLSAVVVVYIAWKSLRKKKSHIHKYGVVVNREDLEMASLESDEEDEDQTTHFDISNHR